MPARPALLASVAALALALPLTTAATANAARVASPPDATTSSGKAVDLGALFIGAHPDDEAFSLSTIGQWKQDHGVRTGVVTVTRGEGGGNAVGPEEGPPLGLLREKEERAAVGKAGITDIVNLDKVDFYYTVSQPLTEQVWGHDDTLARIVRVIRQTRPEVLLTMNPAPSPGQHGNHQEAARLAIEAFYAAADPAAFPEQITKEGLKPFAPAKILRGGATGTGSVGSTCGSTFKPTDATNDVYGVWAGAPAKQGGTWAQVERAAQRMYASQGWAGFPDVPVDPQANGCDFFTQIDSRVPFPAVGTTEAGTAAAILDGATRRAPGGLPLGTGLRVTTDQFDVQRGGAVRMTVSVTAPANAALPVARLRPNLPAGWGVRGNLVLGTVPAGKTVTRAVTVSVPASATQGERSRLGMTVTSRAGTGYADAVVETTAAVTAQQQLLPQVAAFERWATSIGRPALKGIVTPVLTIPSVGSRDIPVTVTNHGTTVQSGTVAPTPPTGFTVTPATRPFTALAPGASTTVTFRVTNSDTTLRTSNEGGTPGAAAGDYAWSITTTTATGSSVARGALELVPTTTIAQASAAPTVDGTEGAGEYPGPAIDISRVWEGDPCTSAADCSATAKVTWRDDTLYVLVHVRDDTLGTVLDASDCKRHWRTDSVELAFDPRGTSENTSTTFKALILPTTTQGRACFGRDADNHQGGPQTAPGMKVASMVTSPYSGYTVETSIPMADLPGAIDPRHLGMDLFVYDSDTQDETGQTRLGWSTWGGVQGDPYRWGVATLPGYTPPAGRPATAPAPVMPLTALQSVDSPPTLAQAVATDISLAGGAPAPTSTAGWLTSARAVSGGVQATLTANAAGTAHVFVVDDIGTAGSVVVPVRVGTGRTVTVPTRRSLGAHPHVLVGWVDGAGRTIASELPLR